MHICPVCNLDGEIWIPIWREDVEGWGDERVICPVCWGKGALAPDQWAERVKSLNALSDIDSEERPAETDG